MKQYLFFASNELEERFRRLVTDSKDEIGGWFLCGWLEDHGLSRREIRKVIPGQIYAIEHIIIAPNLAKKPRGTWSPWDMKKATELSRATAQFYTNWRIHFHTHPGPGKTGAPSDADVAFWQAQGGPGRDSFGCIVTDRPLRLWLWHIDVTLAASPSRTTVTKECGGFLSWRGKVLKGAKK